jgi:hypothetical protein
VTPVSKEGLSIVKAVPVADICDVESLRGASYMQWVYFEILYGLLYALAVIEGQIVCDEIILRPRLLLDT